jgi:hypothetical protein
MSCPAGGMFSICSQSDSSRFIGCCESLNPCNNGCSAGQIVPTSLNASFVGRVPDQDCPIEALFYQCNATTPPFWGCCKSNPCFSNGCPQLDLAPAILSSVSSQYADYIGNSTAGNNSSSAPSSSPSSTSVAKAKSTPASIIIGATLGAVIMLVLLAAGAWALKRKTKHSEPKLGFEPRNDEKDTGTEGVTKLPSSITQEASLIGAQNLTEKYTSSLNGSYMSNRSFDPSPTFFDSSIQDHRLTPDAQIRRSAISSLTVASELYTPPTIFEMPDNESQRHTPILPSNRSSPVPGSSPTRPYVPYRPSNPHASTS